MIEKALIKPYLHPLSPVPTRMKPKGCLRKPIKCLMCDLYGTLFISSSGDIGVMSTDPERKNRLEHLLSRYHQKAAPEKFLKSLRRAIIDQHAIARTKGIEHPEVDIEAIWRKLMPETRPESIKNFAVEFEMLTNPVWPMPGLETLLSTCRQNGIHLGIISNAQFYTRHLFYWLLGHRAEALGFDPKLTIYSFQIGEAKPSATLFAIASRRLHQMAIEPSAVAFIGNDMRKDVVPAHHAGFQSILFAGDQRSLRLLETDPDRPSMEPDMVVTQLEQLATHIQGLL